MKFGDIATDDAEGAILVHRHRVDERSFKKGRQLTLADLEHLRQAGIESVTAVRLEADDIGEDEAASRVAAALTGTGLTASAAFTGRVNLYATDAGVARIDHAALGRANSVDEAVTIATIAPYDVVALKQMVATVKIIPFAVTAKALEESCARATEAAIHVAPFKAFSFGLIQTTLADTKPSILEKTVTVVRDRIEPLGSQLTQEIRCRHDVAEVAGAIAELTRLGCDFLLILGASAILDRRDVVPSAIGRTGGAIDHFGMPVDPGNLLLLAHGADGCPVIGLPSCARSPKLNGFDWVLHRLMAGLDVAGADITAMGAGGLLKDIPSRPLPRAAAARGGAARNVARAPRIAAIILAAGQSRRMGETNKLLADIGGVPMVARVADQVLASQAGPVICVLGHEAGRVRAALAGRDITLVENPDYAQGLSTSLKRGIAAIPEDADGAVVSLGDMPQVTPDVIDRLIAAFDPIEGRAICVPTAQGQRGNPVLWGRDFFEDIAEITGDKGAREIIDANPESTVEVDMTGEGVLLDIDEPKALAALQGTRKATGS